MKKVIISLCFVCINWIALAQKENNLIFGGSFSADFGRFNNRLEVMPTLFKKVVPKLYLGIGTSFSFYQFTTENSYVDNDELIVYDTTTRSTFIGLNFLAQYYPFENKTNFMSNIYIHTELEFLWGKNRYEDDFFRENFSSRNTTVFTGIGYKYRINKKLHMKTSMLFKLNQEEDSPYRTQTLRIGIEF